MLELTIGPLQAGPSIADRDINWELAQKVNAI